MKQTIIKGIYDGERIEMLDKVAVEKPYLVTIHFERELTEDEYAGVEVLKYLAFWPEMPDDFVEEIMHGRQIFFAGRR